MPRRWSIHTKITLLVTGLLLAVGFFSVLGFEWNNAATLGALDTPGKLLAAFFQGVQPRTAGFNTLDYAQMNDDTLLFQDVLMFIGAGSASTGGGIKVTTFALLLLMVLDRDPGDPEVNVFGRRISAAAQRQALALALIALIAVGVVHPRPCRVERRAPSLRASSNRPPRSAPSGSRQASPVACRMWARWR